MNRKHRQKKLCVQAFPVLRFAEEIEIRVTMKLPGGQRKRTPPDSLRQGCCHRSRRTIRAKAKLGRADFP
jgi:hypothetical protein